MIREPFLTRDQWTAKLRRWGCRPAEGMTAANTAEWWRGTRGLFSVPVEDDGTCEFWTIQQLATWFGKAPYS